MPRLLTLLLAALLLPACQRPADDESGAADAPDPTTTAAAGAEGEAEKPPVLVRVRPLRRDAVSRTLEATANVESLDMVDVMPERAEPVVELLVEEGDVVEAGQLLARLRDTDATLAVADATVRVEEARITMEQAKREFERDQKLVDEQGPTGVLAERDLESRRQTYEVAVTAHQSAEVARQQAEVGLAQCRILAPIAGTVTAREISLGDMTTMGTRMFQVTDLASPKVILYRPQRELESLAVGQSLIARAEALPGQEIHGKVERIAPVVDQDTGTVKVTCALEPLADRPLPAGILVRVDLVLETHEDALLVPKEALLYEGDDISCYVIREDRAVEVLLETGFETPTEIEVRGGDITDADLVVVVGADRLEDGGRVEVANE